MIARIRVGDDEALSAVYERYGSVVHGIATQLIGAGDAPDVTQEVFLSLWERPETFDPGRGGLKTYLAVRARGRCLDRLRSATRRMRREVRVTESTHGSSIHEHSTQVEDAAVAGIAAEKLREALSRLPDDQRVAVQLAYLEGLTYQQVAVSMGAPEGTTKSRLRLGLARLGRELSDWNLVTAGEPK